MPVWLTSFLFAVLVVTIPFTLILKILLRLTGPLALAHRKWPLPLNFGLIGVVTVCVAAFIRGAYFVETWEPLSILLQFVIVSLAYVFGLVLLIRQFTGVYPEYIVSTGWAGLAVRKTAYTNITQVEKLSEKYGETRLGVHTRHGALMFTLPTHSVPVFYERLHAKIRPEEFEPHR